MPIDSSLSQVRLLQQVRQAPFCGLGPVFQDPKGQVQVGASQGPVQGCAKVLQDRGQVPRALREALVVLQELPDPLLRLVLDTNAYGRPGPVE